MIVNSFGPIPLSTLSPSQVEVAPFNGDRRNFTECLQTLLADLRGFAGPFGWTGLLFFMMAVSRFSDGQLKRLIFLGLKRGESLGQIAKGLSMNRTTLAKRIERALPDSPLAVLKRPADSPPPSLVATDDQIVTAIDKNRWNISATARELGFRKRESLVKRIRRLLEEKLLTRPKE